VLADSLTFDNQIFFIGFSPDSAAEMNCQAGTGTNFLYRVSVVNGDPIVNNLDVLSEEDADEARQERLEQGGIAPPPAVLFPSPDDPTDCVGPACNPPPILCIGVECRSDIFPPNNPVRTLWTQDGIQ
jgi:type IV pilus assembly protein PilY1